MLKIIKVFRKTGNEVCEMDRHASLLSDAKITSVKRCVVLVGGLGNKNGKKAATKKTLLTFFSVSMEIDTEKNPPKHQHIFS
jgi:hypothetical protein